MVLQILTNSHQSFQPDEAAIIQRRHWHFHNKHQVACRRYNPTRSPYSNFAPLPNLMKVAVVYYSTHGSVAQLAVSIKDGLTKGGAQVDLYRIPEAIPDAAKAKSEVQPKDSSVPFITPDILTQYDAFLFGVLANLGTVLAQWSLFWDSTGGLWALGALYGKPAGIFLSSAGNGGSESTIRNFLSYLVHHGIVYVPLGYATAFGDLTHIGEVRSGSPYGAGTFSNVDGSRKPSALESKVAVQQGEDFAKAAAKLVRPEVAEKKDSSDFTEEKTVQDAKKVQAAAANPQRAAQSQTSAPEKNDSSCGIKCVIM